MELRQLRYFLAVADVGGIRQAAQALHITQPAISRQIKELEEELGVQLFERLPRGLMLTSAGEYYREQLLKVMSDIEKANQSVKRIASGMEGSINLGSVESALWEGIVPNSLCKFRQTNPDITIEMITDNTIKLLEHIDNGTLDCAFVYLFQDLDDSYESVTLRKDNLVLAYPSLWNSRVKDNITIEKLNQLPFIRFPRIAYPAFYDWQQTKFNALGLTPNVIHWAHHESSMLGLVSAGQGVAIVNSKHTARASDLINFIPLNDLQLELPLSFVWKRNSINPVVGRLYSQLVEWANSDRSTFCQDTINVNGFN